MPIDYADASSWIAELTGLSFGHRSGRASLSGNFLFGHQANRWGLLLELTAAIYP
jgi:hypothetical protein